MLPLLKQGHLALPREPLQINYPVGFSGQKSDPDREQIFVSTGITFYSADEVEIIQNFIKKLPYPQRFALTGCLLLADNDPLLKATHEVLDRIEAQLSFPTSREVVGGGLRSTYERVLIIREEGYYGNGSTEIAGFN